MRSRSLLLTLFVGIALSAPPSAFASIATDEGAGQALARELQSGAKRCDRLSAGELEQLGEFVTSRMVRSLDRHEALHQRMRSVLGPANERRMHLVMGRRYAGCAGQSGNGPMMTVPGAMNGGGWSADGTWGPMMGSARWDWMRDGAWERMDRAEWRAVADRWMGPGTMMVSGDDGWGARDLALGAGILLLAAGAVAALAAWRPRFRRPAA